MIYYSDTIIYDWNFEDDNIVKVYRNGAICYYKIVVGSSAQTPCYAVVDDISQYQDTEFIDVFDKATEKWYKLNNLDDYEEYGVYGSGTSITYYQGKLTIDDDKEYIYSGNGWTYIGDVSGGTPTLPNVAFSFNYNARNYDNTNKLIPQTSGQLQNVDAVCNYGSGNIVDHSDSGYISVTGNSRLIFSGNNGTYINRNNTETGCPMTIVSKAKTTNGYSIFTDRNSSSRQYMYRQDTTYAYLCGTGNTSLDACICSSSEPSILSVRVYYDSEVKAKWNNWTTSASSTPEEYKYNTQNLTNGGNLFCDYINSNSEFWQGDFYWIYMTQNALTDAQVQQVIAYNESSGGTEEYPMYYAEKQDPPTSVTFASMAEAEAYQCPYVGLEATIDGEPYVFAQSGDTYYWKENTQPTVDYSTMYLTTEAMGNGAFHIENSTEPFYYSLDSGETWTEIYSNTDVTVSDGDKVLWKATPSNIDSSVGIGNILGSNTFKVYGNIMSMAYGDNFIGQLSLSGKDGIFRRLLRNNDYLVDAENLVLPATTLAPYCYLTVFHNDINLVKAPKELPATTLANYCYGSMFYGCSGLTTAPQICATTMASNSCEYMFFNCWSLTAAPQICATTMADSACTYMFHNCTSLTTAPILSATTLANKCYAYMFDGCSGLTTAPDLPATTLASYCYQNMFYGCTSLTTAPDLPATTLDNSCYRGMFQNCSSLNYIKAMFTTTPSASYTQNWVRGVASSGTFVKNSAATWTNTGVNAVPTNWTIQTASS